MIAQPKNLYIYLFPSFFKFHRWLLTTLKQTPLKALLIWFQAPRIFPLPHQATSHRLSFCSLNILEHVNLILPQSLISLHLEFSAIVLPWAGLSLLFSSQITCTSKEKDSLTSLSKQSLFYFTHVVHDFQVYVYRFNLLLSPSKYTNKSRTLICLFTVIYLGPGTQQKLNNQHMIN